MATNLNFEKFSQEAHEYIKELANELGHPEEKERTLIIWRSVMHTLRVASILENPFKSLHRCP